MGGGGGGGGGVVNVGEELVFQVFNLLIKFDFRMFIDCLAGC